MIYANFQSEHVARTIHIKICSAATYSLLVIDNGTELLASTGLGKLQVGIGFVINLFFICR